MTEVGVLSFVGAMVIGISIFFSRRVRKLLRLEARLERLEEDHVASDERRTAGGSR